MTEQIAITDVIAHPLTARLEELQVTGDRAWAEISMVLVEVRTDAGITGYGECLGRTGPQAYAAAIDRMFKPLLVGQNPLDITRHWHRLQRVLTGRSGGMLMESLAGVDIALWDIAGKVAKLPIHRLLGSMGRTRVDCYASSINWLSDARAEEQVRMCLDLGFKTIKVKFGRPVEEGIRRARLVRDWVGPDIALSVDPNWAFSFDQAVRLGHALSELGYSWFEEPIVPEDVAGYAKLRDRVSVRLAAGESDFTVWHARDLVATRAVGLIQPDVARSGGITETRRIADLAHAFHVAYAPHVGWSGAVCAAASLQLAAAMPAFETFESMIFANPLREKLATINVGDMRRMTEGQTDVPAGPGLGIEINWDTVARYRAA